ncbi:MAG: hypothetical protein J6I98_04040 [Clostridia bacterium]|nr:hypothetical protein [Clostridia bacterium]
MEKKPFDPSSAEPQEELRAVPVDNAPTTDPASPDEPIENADEEQHSHGNYMFALKVLAVLLAIIVIIIILKASGVPIAIKDFLPDFFGHVQPPFPGFDPLRPLF